MKLLEKLEEIYNNINNFIDEAYKNSDKIYIATINSVFDKNDLFKIDYHITIQDINGNIIYKRVIGNINDALKVFKKYNIAVWFMEEIKRIIAKDHLLGIEHMFFDLLFTKNKLDKTKEKSTDNNSNGSLKIYGSIYAGFKVNNKYLEDLKEKAKKLKINYAIDQDIFDLMTHSIFYIGFKYFYLGEIINNGLSFGMTFLLPDEKVHRVEKELDDIGKKKFGIF